MKITGWQQKIQNKYYHLLFMLIAALVMAPFLVGTERHYPIFPCIFVAGILFSLRVLEVKRSFFFFALLVGFSGIIFDVLIQSRREVLLAVLQEIPFLIYAGFLFLSIILLIGKMFSSAKVTSDTIAGGIAVYLLLGFLWTLFYHGIYVVDHNAFRSQTEFNEYSLFHFSFSTLATVGYGDICPVNKLAMSLSSLEAIIGQMYIAIFISRLMGLHVGAIKKNNPEHNI
jgi:hypothetical protein